LADLFGGLFVSSTGDDLFGGTFGYEEDVIYEYRIKLSSESEWGEPQLVESSPYEITGLDPGESYDLQMRAVKDGVYGDWSETETFSTEELIVIYLNNSIKEKSILQTLNQNYTILLNNSIKEKSLNDLYKQNQKVLNTPTKENSVEFNAKKIIYEYRLSKFTSQNYFNNLFISNDVDYFGGLFITHDKEIVRQEYHLDPSPATIENLEPFTEYELEIRAIVNGVAGDWSEPERFITEIYEVISLSNSKILNNILHNNIQNQKSIININKNYSVNTNYEKHQTIYQNINKNLSIDQILNQNQNTSLNDSKYNLSILINTIRLYSTGNYIECHDMGDFDTFDCHDMGEYELEVF